MRRTYNLCLNETIFKSFRVASIWNPYTNTIWVNGYKNMIWKIRAWLLTQGIGDWRIEDSQGGWFVKGGQMGARVLWCMISHGQRGEESRTNVARRGVYPSNRGIYF